MNNYEKYILLKTVQDDNILPITSVCNMSCIFCSHKFNPPDIELFRFGHLKITLIEELLDYINADFPLIIGESASRIIEGEPFIHPDFDKIIQLIRKKFPQKEIRITTNGGQIREKTLLFLNKMGPIELNISINAATSYGRSFLMHDKKANRLFENLKKINDYNIKFNGSIVAMPHLLGWEYLERTVQFLDKCGFRMVRIFMPGFTKLTDEKLKFDINKLKNKLKKLVVFLNKKYKIAVIMEPPDINNLNAEINAILPNSPADRAGLSPYDIIEKIDNIKVESRVDAFHKVLDSSSPLLKIKRKETIQEIKLNKAAKERSGLIMDYDLPLELIKDLEHTIKDYKYQKILLISSKLAKKIIFFLKNLLHNNTKKQVESLVIENYFFGGSIMTAGLLVIDDIIKTIRKVDEFNYDLIILPGIIFDKKGNDLSGKHYSLIEREFNTKLKIVDI